MKTSNVPGRNSCNDDVACLAAARLSCDGDMSCFGVSWFGKPNLTTTSDPDKSMSLQICHSMATEAQPPGLFWRTMLKCVEHDASKCRDAKNDCCVAKASFEQPHCADGYTVVR